MPLVIPDGFAQVSFIHRGVDSSGDVVCTCGFNLPDPFSITDYGALLWSAWAVNVLPVISTDIVFTRVHVSYTTGGEPHAHDDQTVPLGVAGSAGGTKLPDNCAALIRKVTVLSGRKFRGRMYLPGVTQSFNSVSPNRLDSIDRDQYDTSMNNFRVALLAEDVLPYILHNDATAPTLITTFTAQFVLATQRNRLRD